jgi:hypothetical protein
MYHKIRFLIRAMGVGSLLLATGCATVNSVAVSSIPANRSNEVSAEASRWVILGLNFDNDFVDQVARDLGHRCPNGKISGILTKDETYLYFLALVHKRRVVATGFCEKHNMANTQSVRKHAENGAAPADSGRAPASTEAQPEHAQ